ncbi:Crinkler (CRN) family protein [Phytophthora cinnamomi]|uniref:Crinkler (CRN) family protein n=2 Tax=Phytophthora cinnamomi TaxID=4785 RepID=UPI003559BDF9|nr:Crinkler (CRN) family protein [Phytophthora cinnamomi]
MLTMVDGVSVKIVHSMLVTGDAETLLRFLPAALTRTVNTHPRMRALQVKDEDFMAEIQPPVTIDDVANKKLLRVRRFSESESTEGDFEDWQAYVEGECNVGFDRYTQFPFFLVVWVDETAERARLMLFSDHYMSDGRSGMVVLNCVLEQASLLSMDEKVAKGNAEELPLHPSFYELWLSKNLLSKALVKGLMALLGTMIYRSELKKFSPILPAREDQQDFVVPPVTNSTSASFAQGDPVRMREALSTCRAQGATFGGALVAAVTVAFYYAAKDLPDYELGQPFKFLADLDYNMRQRLPCPVEENQVGAYIAFTDLAWLADEGVDLETTQFWDLARRAKKEIDGNLRNTLSMDVVTVIMDQKINAKIKPSVTERLNIRHSQTSDANISNVGRYPFSREFSLASIGHDNQSKLTVTSLHVYNPIPHLGPSAVFFVSSVDSFCYSMGNKCTDATAKALFSAWVDICENVGNIQAHDTLLDVLGRLNL